MNDCLAYTYCVTFTLKLCTFKRGKVHCTSVPRTCDHPSHSSLFIQSMKSAESGVLGTQPRRPLPLPTDQPSLSRRALPTPPGIPRTDVASSRSRRALPPVPNASTAMTTPEMVLTNQDRPMPESRKSELHSQVPDNRFHASRPAVPQDMHIDKQYHDHRIPPYPGRMSDSDRDGHSSGRETPTQANWSSNDDAGGHLEQQEPYSNGTNNALDVRRAGPSTDQKTSYRTLATNGPDLSRQSSPVHNTARQSVESTFWPEPYPRRQPSTRSSLQPSISSINRSAVELSPSWNDQSQAPSAWVERKLQIHQSHRADLYDDDSVFRPESQYGDEEEWDEEEDVEVDESRFFNRALLSEMAVQVKDKVLMGRHTKAGIAWVGSFTGRDVVVSPQRCSQQCTAEAIRQAFKVSCRHTPATPRQTVGTLSSVLIRYRISCGLSKLTGILNHFETQPKTSFVLWVRWKAWVLATHSLGNCLRVYSPWRPGAIPPVAQKT